MTGTSTFLSDSRDPISIYVSFSRALSLESVKEVEQLMQTFVKDVEEVLSRE